jgi:hypothetical protein
VGEPWALVLGGQVLVAGGIGVVAYRRQRATTAFRARLDALAEQLARCQVPPARRPPTKMSCRSVRARRRSR